MRIVFIIDPLEQLKAYKDSTVAMIALGLHLYHGIWSAFQTMGLDGPRLKKWREPVALGVAVVVVLVNLSFPVAVFAGIIP